ncbi:hypothetical protein [Halocatena salina]|uniref:Uncharacterized protein n=1 Tax=Halocatena salina TaxID=2934340 RepID=A0A8U0A4I9_9EURY|nr:hypothetical protein MW046_12635 [Halocatena salina]
MATTETDWIPYYAAVGDQGARESGV